MSDPANLNRDTPFQVSNWLVDPANNQILLGGHNIRLEPKVMDVLVYLAERPGQVISREELEDNVWAGRIVTYDALTATIVKLRKAFQSDKKKNTIIKTVPKRGYCLVAPVTQEIPQPDNPGDSEQENSSVSEPKQTVEKPAKEITSSERERRQVTIVACEILTDYSAGMDPEEQLEMLSHFQDICSRSSQQYGGHIGQFTNGQLNIYFGYPVAHEGDAERGVRTALDIIDNVQVSLNRKHSSGNSLPQVKIGIHSGLVVIGENSGNQQMEQLSVIGDIPRVAGVLRDIASPGSVMISEATKQLVNHLFDLSENSDAQPGLPNAVYFQVNNTSPGFTRFDKNLIDNLHPLVGREIEIDLLLKRWEQVRSAESQVVCLCADAGMGKTRILQGLQERLKNETHQRVLLLCSPHHTNSSLYPVATCLQQHTGIQAGDESHLNLQKLETWLENIDLDKTKSAPVFAELLSIPCSDNYRGFNPEPQELKELALQGLVNLFRHMSENEPLLFMVEDAHWIDPTTRELIDLLIRELNNERILFVSSYRPEFDPPWSGYMQTTLLRLNRLGRDESINLIGNIAGDTPIPDELRDQIIARADGVPLFIEELTKSIITSMLSREGKQHHIAIPASLQDLLMARLDRLHAARHIAQLASIIGRTFSHELLQAVASEADEQLDRALAELIEAELIFKRGVPPDIQYEFKHALVQSTAYQSLLKSARQKHHRKIAEVLQAQFPQISRTQPEVLAHHYSEAQEYQQAVHFWLQAGQRASELSANIEAISHLKKGQELLHLVPDEQQRTQYELRLLLTLGPALLSAKGLGARDAEKVYLRARELCHEAGEQVELFTVTWGLWLLCQKRGRLKEAQKFSGELLVLAEQLSNPEYLLQAHHAAWTTSFRLSDFENCHRHAEQGLEIYDMEAHRHHACRFGSHDPGVCAYYNFAMVQWLLGKSEQAQTSISHAVELAEKLSHPFSRVLAHVFNAFVAQCCGNVEQAKKHSLAVIDLCRIHKIAPDCAAQARAIAGWVKSVSGDLATGIHEMEEAIIALRNTGVRTHEPYLLSILASCYAQTDQPEQGLRVITEALAAINETGERTFEAEIYRLQGALQLSAGNKNMQQAINNLQKAIVTAREQHALSLELRATMSLAEAQPENETTIKSLASIYQQFSEGHETTDLRNAAALLGK